MLSSYYKLLFIKRMHLIGMVFYEPDLDLNNKLKSMWSPDDMMATNNAVMQEDRVFRQIASTRHLERLL